MQWWRQGAGWDREEDTAAEACILLDRGTGARLENKTTASARTRYGAGLPDLCFILCAVKLQEGFRVFFWMAKVFCGYLFLT